ncbi:MAG: type I 3-dehydroquinate dehydratase [Candidatus Cloacimonetes bacterium]|nr:type I 3-dehydroquinate dehydratase [Candidatus Cloacimonadota bacterium]MCF7813820.1 type I 3-dehydroquinate dehydratase [Candidatus Cloacimonadota bacterium]MCF7868499.1 type I 3-dehydroquinate dehydratase [Candidatus Cloacimonadota bacterium]
MLILSIPFFSSEFVTKHSQNRKFPWKEYRLDFNEHLNDFPQEILDETSIVTIRDISEGGKNDFPLKDKVEFYKKAIQQSNCLVDFEVQQYEKKLINPENLILSYHDFTNDFDFEKLKKVIDSMNNSDARFIKIAVGVDSYTSLIRIYNLIAKCKKPVIFAGLGNRGKISRLLHKHLGAKGTFIGLENNQTALGQILDSDVDLYNLHKITPNSKIGGIIGGKQIEHSLGLKFYNDYFQKNKLDAYYFPFETDGINDFLRWLENCRFFNKFFGFSVTMPFKKSIIRQPINLYIPNRDFYLNTDQEAFYKILDMDFVTIADKVLIFGSGAMARTALNSLNGFSNIFISGRNVSEGHILAEKFNCDFLKIEEAKKLSFDLLINCAPIGMKDEDFSKETGISKFRKVIDLPYQIEDTKLIEFCKKKEIPCVDGKQFWKWQAERQLQEFAKEIKNQ